MQYSDLTPQTPKRQDRGNEMNAIQQVEGLTFKIHRKPAVPVASVADAAAKWNAYLSALAQNMEDYGCSKVGNGGIVRQGKKIVARISYNGRIWE